MYKNVTLVGCDAGSPLVDGEAARVCVENPELDTKALLQKVKPSCDLAFCVDDRGCLRHPNLNIASLTFPSCSTTAACRACCSASC